MTLETTLRKFNTSRIEIIIVKKIFKHRIVGECFHLDSVFNIIFMGYHTSVEIDDIVNYYDTVIELPNDKITIKSTCLFAS